MRKKSEIYLGEKEETFLLKCSLDFGLFCERVLGYTMKDFHKEWCFLLRTENRIAISAPTGYGKTWIFGVAYPLWRAYFKPGDKSLIVSKTVKGQSSTVLEQVRFVIENNELLKELIPSDRRLFTWTKERIVCSNNSHIFNAPYSQSIRGHHVDYIFGDEVSSFPDRPDNYSIWFRDVLSRVADSKYGKVAAVSTPIDSGDLLTVLINRKGWYSKIYPAIVGEDGKIKQLPYEKGISIWPERFSIEKLMFIRDEQGVGQFERNYMCNANAPVEKAIFNLKKLVGCYDYDRDFTTKSEGGIVFMGADFALSDDPHSDFDAYVVIEKISESMIIKHIEIHRGFPTEMKIKRLSELAELHEPYQIICDESNVGRHIVSELLNLGHPTIAHPFGPKSRNQLISVLKIISDGENLVIPYSKENYKCQELADMLVEQIMGFREAKSVKTNNILIESKAPHDDIAMALALAAKGAKEQSVGLGGFASGGDRIQKTFMFNENKLSKESWI